jgi:hypothetical protein
MATQRAVWFQEDSTPEQRRDEKREAQQQIRTRAYDNWRASPDAGRRIEHLLNEGPALVHNIACAPGAQDV